MDDLVGGRACQARIGAQAVTHQGGIIDTEHRAPISPALGAEHQLGAPTVDAVGVV